MSALPAEDPAWSQAPVHEIGGITRQLQFAARKDAILKKKLPVLKVALNAIRSLRVVRTVSIEDHSNSAGNAEKDLVTSKRAEAVKA